MWLPKYFTSELYKEKIDEKKTRMRDVVEDVLYLKNKVDSDDVQQYFKIFNFLKLVI